MTSNVEKQKHAYNQYQHEYDRTVEPTHRRLYPLTIELWLPLLKDKDILDAALRQCLLIELFA